MYFYFAILVGASNNYSQKSRESPDSGRSSVLSRYSSPLPPILSNVSKQNSSKQTSSTPVTNIVAQFSIAKTPAPPQKPKLYPNRFSKSSKSHDRAKKSLSIAIKLPDGQRITGQFKATDQLIMIKQLAEKHCGYSLDTFDIALSPSLIFSNANTKLEDLKITDKSLLYLYER